LVVCRAVGWAGDSRSGRWPGVCRSAQPYVVVGGAIGFRAAYAIAGGLAFAVAPGLALAFRVTVAFHFRVTVRRVAEAARRHRRRVRW